MTDDDYGSIDEGVRRRFETAGIDGNPQQLEDLIADVSDEQRTATLRELVCIDVEFRWKRFADKLRSEDSGTSNTATGGVSATRLGQPRPAWESSEEESSRRRAAERPPAIESYLDRFPSLRRDDALSGLIQEEFRQRLFAGEDPTLDEYRSRFPELEVDDTLEANLLNATVVASPEQLAANSESVSGETLLGPEQTREFGGYVLRRELGRGGMGIVYEALETATERVVALKVVRRDRLENMPADMQSEMLARFRTETMTAARLDHDHIVTVYEVGEHAGRRFFSMQFVDGPSLAGRVRQGVLTNRQAAGYMVPIAAAVHEAHTRGVLHRDIKPHNIMVDQRTDRPLIGDFGLAKLMEHDQNLTQDGDIVGTPAYASPEQIRDPAQVGVQGDVYSLGATLYHLLVGHPPFQAPHATEIISQVLFDEPLRPSQVNAQVDRDLETICLKCLDKEPSRRYASARELADELSRYLQGRPIVARPLGFAGRTYRWCRRNRMLSAWIGSALVCVGLAAVFAVRDYINTARLYERNQDEVRRTRIAEQMAQEEADRAKASEQRTRQTVDELFTEVSENVLFNQPGMEPVRKKLLDKTLAHYRHFVENQQRDQTASRELGRTYYRIGRITRMLNSPSEAQDAFAQAYNIQAKLYADESKNAELRNELAATCTELGQVAMRQRNFESAGQMFNEAEGLRSKLAAQYSGDRNYRRKLANAYMNQGLLERRLAVHQQEFARFAVARRRFEQAQADRTQLLEQQPDDIVVRREFAAGYYNLAIMVQFREGVDPREYKEAVGLMQNAIDEYKRIEQVDARDLKTSIDLETYKDLTNCYRMLGDLFTALASDSTLSDEEAEEVVTSRIDAYNQARKRAQKLFDENPQNNEYRRNLGMILLVCGDSELSAGQVKSGVDNLAQAVRNLDVLVNEKRNPDALVQFGGDLGLALKSLGIAESVLEQHEAALQHLIRSEQIFVALIEQESLKQEHAYFQEQLAETRAVLGKVKQSSSKPTDGR